MIVHMCSYQVYKKKWEGGVEQGRGREGAGGGGRAGVEQSGGGVEERRR